ncbi:MAG: hypothetical protein NWT08_08045 [Akkermansiaceae bacterium]|jgi:hypothetical protein|nr:hypothetical protein [Akkermansiaceae bacterium]MDP4647897.1 hypothetical protein [Akkermansiaceae bacterium]MDP4719687.1 hypothetical protein [Akkermansiaceae bacterium]MDP4779757.1 hypothetical protein [Akkermansiaceae bacterium]MDP4845998.1 hypothetical protein [Akkermansiaceae bacterium]
MKVGIWFLSMNRQGDTEENRGKQILAGGLIMLVLTVLVVTLLVAWRMIPGLVGDSVGFVVGIMSTPFFMEASFALIGLMIVISLNIWRRRKDGDELVYLDELECREKKGD